jgi:NAD(P)-dependent dehydrogenase (short-subunit alcohol dehydrogenase family)
MTVTGASSGFGKALTEVVLREGDIVVATLRKPSVLAPLTKQYPPTQLLLLPLDVTCPSDITAAFTRTQEIFGRLDVVFNNAGFGIFCEVEGTPDADARALFDVNFWGAVGVSRAAVKFFREVNPPGKGGVILQNSSMSGFLGVAGGAFYCAR